MKSRYALPVFFLAVALFWLSLLLTSNLRRTPAFHEVIDVPYMQIEGIDSLELAHSDKNLRHHGSIMNIRYADQPHITLKIKNIENPDTTIKQLFTRQGKRLILQPESHQAATENTENDKNHDQERWTIKEIVLPLHIHRLHTRGIELDIAEKMADEENDPIQLTLPKLHIESEDTGVKLNNIHIASLNIRNRYNKQSCLVKNHYIYHHDRITLYSKAKADALFIESVHGRIDLNNSAAIQTLHLKTTPETSIELDRLGVYPRMRWEPLPTPPLPECQEGTERMAASPAMKAQ